MGTTSNLSLPYPEDTDYVSNGYADIQALAGAVDAYWGPITSYSPGGTVNLTSPTITCRYHVVGHWVDLSLTLSAGTASSTGLCEIEIPFTTAAYKQLILASHNNAMVSAWLVASSSYIVFGSDTSGNNWNNGHNLATIMFHGRIEIEP